MLEIGSAAGAEVFCKDCIWKGKNPVLPSAATESVWLLFGSRAQRRASSGSEAGAAAEKCRLSR